ncbi:MAG: MFS transporter [Myxococcota bacterium]
MVKSHVEESLGANPADAALNPADSVAMGVQSAEVEPTQTPGFLASSRGRAFRALAHRPFRLLFVSFLVNQTGFWISHISLQGLMVEITNNDPFQLGSLFFALFLPAFVLAPVAGVVADRFDRKRIMLVCYAGVAATMLCVGWLTWSDRITAPLMLGLGFALGTCFSFSGPASFAVAANTVPGADLPSAVSLQSAANNLTRVFGPALAAPLVATSRFEVAFAVFFVASLVAAFLTSRMHIAAYVPEADEGGVFGRLRIGLAHARDRRPALAALLTVAALSFFGVSHVAVLPVFAADVFGRQDLFAWIVAASGLGAMIGAIATGYEHQATLRGAAVRMGLYGVSLVGFALTTHLWVALGTQVLIGYFYFAVMTSLQTLIQQIVDEGKRGRVMSLFQVAWAGLVPFGGFAMGAATDGLGVVPTLAGAAVACIAIAAWVVAGANRWSAPRREG